MTVDEILTCDNLKTNAAPPFSNIRNVRDPLLENSNVSLYCLSVFLREYTRDPLNVETLDTEGVRSLVN